MGGGREADLFRLSGLCFEIFLGGICGARRRKRLNRGERKKAGAVSGGKTPRGVPAAASPLHFPGDARRRVRSRRRARTMPTRATHLSRPTAPARATDRAGPTRAGVARERATVDRRCAAIRIAGAIRLARVARAGIDPRAPRVSAERGAASRREPETALGPPHQLAHAPPSAPGSSANPPHAAVGAHTYALVVAS